MFVFAAKLNKTVDRRRSGCVVDKQAVGAQAAHQSEPCGGGRGGGGEARRSSRSPTWLKKEQI